MISITNIKKEYLLLFVLLVTCIIYLPVLNNDFLYYWDDQWMVMNSYTTGGWTLDNLWLIFTDFYNGQYGPFTELSYLIIYTFFGYDALWFHLASLLWHLGCVIFVWKLIYKLLEMHGSTSDSDMRLITFFTTLLFAIHPMNVETIAWISAVKALIYGFFYLLGLLYYIQYIQTQKIGYYIAVMACFIASFLGKEQAVTFPIALVIIDWFTNRNLKSSIIWNEKLIFFIMALFFGLVTILSQGNGGQGTTYPLWQRLVFACYALIEYITKSLFPIQLNYLYPFPILPGEALPVRFYIYPILIACLSGWIFLYRKNKYLIVGIMLFIANLITSIHIIPMSRHSVVADRYLYLSYIGIAFLIAYGLSLIKAHKRYFKYTLFLFFIYSLFLSGYTYRYTQQWRNTGNVKKYMKELLEKRKKEEKPM